VTAAGLRARNKERKRDALVRAGRALFLAKGFDETTTRAIAAKAGVASGFLERRRRRQCGAEFLGQDRVERHGRSIGYRCPLVKDTLRLLCPCGKDTMSQGVS